MVWSFKEANSLFYFSICLCYKGSPSRWYLRRGAPEQECPQRQVLRAYEHVAHFKTLNECIRKYSFLLAMSVFACFIMSLHCSSPLLLAGTKDVLRADFQWICNPLTFKNAHSFFRCISHLFYRALFHLNIFLTAWLNPVIYFSHLQGWLCWVDILASSPHKTSTWVWMRAALIQQGDAPP